MTPSLFDCTAGPKDVRPSVAGCLLRPGAHARFVGQKARERLYGIWGVDAIGTSALLYSIRQATVEHRTHNLRLIVANKQR